MYKNSIDRFFDYNKDGELNMFEKTMKWEFFSKPTIKQAMDTLSSDRSSSRRHSESYVDDYDHYSSAPAAPARSGVPCGHPVQVSFDPDGTYSSKKSVDHDRNELYGVLAGVLNAVAVKKNSEALSAELESKPAAPVSTAKSKNAAAKGIKIFFVSLLLILFVYVIIDAFIQKNHYMQIEDYCSERAEQISKHYGLDFEGLTLYPNSGERSGTYSADYYLYDMSDLTYVQMYDLADALNRLMPSVGKDHVLVFLNFIYSDGDEYKISTSTISIYLNGKKLDDSFSYYRSNKERTDKKESPSVTKVYPSSTPYVPKKSKVSTANDHDEFNAKDYSNPEDFYDDNYYDFFDYYDAEDYYYEHCD